MAFTLSRYLRLRLDSNLTANARYNLEKIDLLGSTLSIDSTSSVNFRSRTDINIEPQSQIAGGSGVGGIVSIGSSGHEIEEFRVYATTVTGLLPDQTGHAGEVLTTDGTTATWETSASSNAVQSSEGNWLTADGLTKTFIHGLNNTDVLVSVIDTDTNELIHVDSVTATSVNTITLVASEAPANSWRLTVHAD